MDEGFKFQPRRALPDELPHLLNGQLPGQHDPLHPLLPPKGGGLGVEGIGLGAQVQGHMGRQLPGHADHPRVVDDQGVRLRLRRLLQQLG